MFTSYSWKSFYYQCWTYKWTSLSEQFRFNYIRYKYSDPATSLKTCTKDSLMRQGLASKFRSNEKLPSRRSQLNHPTKSLFNPLWEELSPSHLHCCRKSSLASWLPTSTLSQTFPGCWVNTFEGENVICSVSWRRKENIVQTQKKNLYVLRSTFISPH